MGIKQKRNLMKLEGGEDDREKAFLSNVMSKRVSEQGIRSLKAFTFEYQNTGENQQNQ